jgi:hypothetical protein
MSVFAVVAFATGGVNTALAQTPVNSSVSASATADKGGSTVVDTPFGKLSFTEIRKHEKKDEILDDHMKPEESKAYIIWEK